VLIPVGASGDDGSPYALAAPAESQRRRAGDQVLVCLEGDNIDGEERLAAAGL